MTHYYLGLGYGKTYSDGTFDSKPTLPLTDDNLISNNSLTISEDKDFDDEQLVKDKVSELQPGDTLVVSYPNKEAFWFDDDEAEANNVPHNQREELWNNDGIVETFTHFTNAQDEEWAWLINE
jgi:hypothetical protein